MIQGQDWASYQSATPSTAGLAFTFIKATEGTNYVSPRMASQTAHARAGGLVVGFYHFLRAGDMKAQAAYFVNRAASLEGDILAADWEDGGVSCAQKDQFIREVKRLRPTHKVVLYCNTSYWKTRDSTSYAGDGLWIADPNHAAGHPGIQADWLIQQYSSAGGVDRNVLNPAHFPTAAALRAWAGGDGTTTDQQEDDDMPLSSADVEKIATTDCFPAPRDASDYDPNPKSSHAYWTLGTHMRAQTEGIRAVAKTVAATNAAIKALAGMVGAGVDTDAVVAAVEKAIKDAVITVDINSKEA
ncbi:GH25 family lysozyme [Streptomyces sp. NPDC051320]|uniref:GH25 family lysozyme n=1 Tax=Streptomyces sp. NPDC051320 TaxID=3154644 RepID=UPI0034180A71